MNTQEPIIDVTPVSSSRTRTTVSRTPNYSGTAGTWNTASRTSTPQGAASFWDTASRASTQDATGTWNTTSSGGSTATRSIETRMSGLAQMAIGAGLVMIGIPMLILPGPGLLSIFGGLALAANGFQKAFG